MEENIQRDINRLAAYALSKQLISENEKYYSINLLLDVLNLDEYVPMDVSQDSLDLEDILKDILDWAYSQKLFAENTVVYRDLFDTKVMNCFVPRPDTVVTRFNTLLKKSSKAATAWYYRFSQDSDYIRSYRIKKDIRWKTKTPYGAIDITVNLSKPEKDPKAIAAAKLLKQTSYPKCQLCEENMGYRGRVNHPARETIRIIPLTLDGDNFFLQYSPYSYYNEHCIVFNQIHKPMVVDEKAMRHLLDFVELFPHYMLGSNADLPIVGGSILTHDHYQGGGYVFPMFKAKDVFRFTFKGYPQIQASYLYWPLSVIRLKSANKEKLLKLSVKVLNCWRKYEDKECFIIPLTPDNLPHSTITPIVHKEGKLFVMDLALRNNITTDEYPLGVYHPHAEYWNIKKENIGLIEVMGTAILPSRLKQEMAAVKAHLLAHEDLGSDELTAKHAEWVKSFIGNYPKLTADNLDGILEDEIGKTFVKVMECAGVYKQDEKGYLGVKRFLESVNRS
ncbi:MAG: UDP-glucose--hexose-1-phosphate uridylyltransferase [Bacilli bacterium]|jgi:UDPglucose--hexose-1-phosphate uridylyltransferase|nr:UDP-glucose--hexose-1-phosphate uridylyltransferase [Bacilli bacterium]